jgi:hypothetical protein
MYQKVVMMLSMPITSLFTNMPDSDQDVALALWINYHTVAWITSWVALSALIASRRVVHCEDLLLRFFLAIVTNALEQQAIEEVPEWP